MIDEVIKMGDFNHGDRVRVKYEYQGKTYAARAKRQGIWIVDKFLHANLELKRPADAIVPHGHFKRLRAKPYMLEKVPDTTGSAPPSVEEPKPTLQSIHLKDVYFAPLADVKVTQSTKPNWMEHGASASKKIKDLTSAEIDLLSKSTPPKPSQPFVFKPGMVVLVKDPDDTDKFKGLYVIVEYGHTDLNWINIAPMFGEGKLEMARTEWVTVIPAKDLTITYLPQ